MKDIKDFVKTNEDGTITIDYDAYNAELKSELDRARTQASNTAKENAEKQLKVTLEKEIKAKLEEEAKMTAEEKLKVEREALLEEKKKFDQERIVKIYEDAGIGKDEIEILSKLISDNSEVNLETAKKFADARKAANEVSKKAILEELQLSKQKDDNFGGGGGGDDDLGAKWAKTLSSQAPSAYVDLSPNVGGEINLNK